MCNDVNIVSLGFEKQPTLTKAQPIVNFFTFFKDSRRDSKGSVILNHIEVLSKTPYDSNEISTAFLNYVGELCVQ